jgi:hypothetical protein
VKTAGSRFASSGPFIALLLIAFSASGLMAGMLARQVSGPTAGAQPTSTGLSSAEQTATAAANSTPTGSGSFALKVQLAPNPIHIGQTMQLTVTACAPDTKPVCGPNSTTMPGVLCTPQQTSSAPTFSDAWPLAQPTDSAGQAHWTLAVSSQTTPGAYQIAVHGDGTGYSGNWYGTLVVTA